VVLPQSLKVATAVNLGDPMEGIFVVVYALFLGEEHALRQTISGDFFVVFMCAQSKFCRLHKSHVDEILELDLVHKVLDHDSLRPVLIHIVKNLVEI
jgi:hypothetical protein